MPQGCSCKTYRLKTSVHPWPADAEQVVVHGSSHAFLITGSHSMNADDTSTNGRITANRDGECRSNRRYPVGSVLVYRIISGGRVSRTSSGQTINMSTSGI